MSTPAEAPKKRRMLPVLLAFTVAMSAGAATALTPGSPLHAAMGGAPAEAPSAHADDAPTDDDAADDDDAPFGEFVEMDALVINPRGTDGRRYLMARVGVEAATPETLERLDVLGPAASDAILESLSSRTVAELSNITLRDSLKQDIRSSLNRVLGDDGPVTRVYFTQYVLQ